MLEVSKMPSAWMILQDFSGLDEVVGASVGKGLNTGQYVSLEERNASCGGLTILGAKKVRNI